MAEERLYKIGEVCKLADVQPYVLRYWETEFPALAPNKSGGGQRLYSQREIDIILRIKQLLYADGFTIAGAKKKLEESGGPALAGGGPALAGGGPALAGQVAPENKPDVNKALLDAKRELRAILTLLEE